MKSFDVRVGKRKGVCASCGESTSLFIHQKCGEERKKKDKKVGIASHRAAKRAKYSNRFLIVLGNL